MSWIQSYKALTAPPSAPIRPGQIVSDVERSQAEEVVFSTGARLLQTRSVFGKAPDHYTIDDHGTTVTREGHFEYHQAARDYGLPQTVQLYSKEGQPLQEIRDDDCVVLNMVLPGQSSSDPIYLLGPACPLEFSNPRWLRSARVSPEMPGVVELKTSARELELGTFGPLECLQRKGARTCALTPPLGFSKLRSCPVPMPPDPPPGRWWRPIEINWNGSLSPRE